MSNPHDLSPAAFNLALSYVDRAMLVPGHKLQSLSDRYLRLMNMVNDTMQDELLRKDAGADNLVAVFLYFLSKYNEHAPIEIANKRVAT